MADIGVAFFQYTCRAYVFFQYTCMCSFNIHVCVLSIYMYVYANSCLSYVTNFESFIFTFRVVQTKGWMLTGILDAGSDAKYPYSLNVVRSLLLSDQ